jgi:phosphoenolpyruvate synthase/pyruvate phosphate dikinase
MKFNQGTSLRQIDNSSSAIVGGKASSLLYLDEHGFNVPVFVPLAFEDLHQQDKIEQKLATFLSSYPDINTCAVRSSVSHEDGRQASFAGKYSTMLDVPADLESILSAIKIIKQDVETNSDQIKTYTSTLKVDFDERLGIVIQKMVESPEFAGVVFSRGTDNPHYMEVSYHNGMGEDLVSGKVNGRQIKVARGMVPAGIQKEIPFLPDLLRDVQAIESLYGFPVDIEFAYKNGELFILQARPIKGMHEVKPDMEMEQQLGEFLNTTRQQVGEILEDNFLGNMIDINPQELLGKYPLPLSFSLFSEMFPARVIPGARRELGYECSQNNCLHLLGGRAFIDFKTAASNFRPEGIGEEDYQKIYAYYLSEIRKNPSKQNKVEFELFFSLNNEDTRRRLAEIFEGDQKKVDYIVRCFDSTSDRIEARTAELMENLGQKLSDYLHLIGREKERMEDLVRQEETGAGDLKEFFVSIVENIQKYGTSLFTQVARMDFYYNRKLAEYLEKKGLTDRGDILLSGNKSIYMEFVEQLLKMIESPEERNRLEAAFEEKFGHMRQSQFDLHEPNYSEQKVYEKSLPETSDLKQKLEDSGRKYQEYQTEMQRLKGILTGEDYEELKRLVEKTRFCDEARERVKFIFMKEYDLLRPLLMKIKDNLRLDGFDDVFYLSYEDILDCLADGLTGETGAKEKIVRNRSRERIFRQMEMPDVIREDYDTLAVQNRASEAVFISGLPEVSGEIFYVPKASELADFEALRDKILLLEDSDQGSSHLFNFGIRGVITKVGSAHSHMAVLLREYGLPAVLAVGEEMFRRLKAGGRVSINCRDKKFKIES